MHYSFLYLCAALDIVPHLKDCGQEETGATEDEMVAWDHQPNGHEFEQALGDVEGQPMGSQRVRHDLATEQQCSAGKKE